MIKVCDALMGSGKTESAITYMNEHADEKFIFVTPYLDEAARIKSGCPELCFAEPSNKRKEFEFSKAKHTAQLIKDGRNITTTHEAFKSYNDDMLLNIKDQGYNLIIDENLNILERSDIDSGDINVLINGGYIEMDGNVCKRTDLEYTGRFFNKLLNMMLKRGLIRLIGIDGKEELYYWTLPPDLINSFKNVTVLTYLFEGQSLYCFFKMNNMDYEKIGVEYDGTTYRFGEYPGYIPEYTKIIKDKITIIDNDKLNSIGDDRFALSMSWFKKSDENVRRAKNNTYNFFFNMTKNVPAKHRMWSTYCEDRDKIKGKGYSKGFLSYNMRATNAYRDKKTLAYMVNIFMNVGEKLFYQSHGVTVNEDMYALSTMVQWIWRSAIRDGEDICIYIPSSRMRNILQNWIEEMSKGGLNS